MKATHSTNGHAEKNGHTPTNRLPSTPSVDGRASNGQFVPGNKIGRGNPFGRQAAQLRAALVNSVTATDMQRLAQRLMEMSIDGNLEAARLLLSYCVGKPDAPRDPDRSDLDELLLLSELPNHEAATLLLSGMDPVQVADLVLNCAPTMFEGFRQRILEHLATSELKAKAKAHRERMSY